MSVLTAERSLLDGAWFIVGMSREGFQLAGHNVFCGEVHAWLWSPKLKEFAEE